METFSALLAICAGNSPVSGEFPTQRPVTRSCDVFFDLRLNKGLSKQSGGWWFETLSRPLWRHCNVAHQIYVYKKMFPIHPQWQTQWSLLTVLYDFVIFSYMCTPKMCAQTISWPRSRLIRELISMTTWRPYDIAVIWTVTRCKLCAVNTESNERILNAMKTSVLDTLVPLKYWNTVVWIFRPPKYIGYQ